jgi:hypothetical protein
LVGHASGGGELVQPGEELALRQIAGGAEQDEDVGIELVCHAGSLHSAQRVFDDLGQATRGTFPLDTVG